MTQFKVFNKRLLDGTRIFAFSVAGKCPLLYSNSPRQSQPMLIIGYKDVCNTSLYRRTNRLYNMVVNFLKKLTTMYYPFGPIYIERHSRDCDLCHRWWVEEHPSMYSVLKSMDRAYEWAEGPESFSVISEADYIRLRDAGEKVWDQAAELAGY